MKLKNCLAGAMALAMAVMSTPNVTAYDLGLTEVSVQSAVREDGTNDYTTEDGNFTYTVSKDDTVTITRYKGSSKEVQIPSKIDGKTVTAIGAQAFSWNSNITDLTLPNTITTIDSYAFRSCTSLTSLVIPKSVETIGNYAFAYCSAITSLTLNKGLTSIGESAFRELESIEELEIPGTVTAVGDYAFYNCTKLKTVKIDDGATTIGAGMFFQCKALTKVEIPSSVTSIGNEAFRLCSSLDEITIPEGVTEIGSYMISGTSITEITLPGTLTEIADYAFARYTNYPYGDANLEKIVFKGKITSIGAYAFRQAYNLTDIVLPDSVTSIGAYAFSECTSLEEIAIPGKVETIGNYAFNGCKALKAISIPASVSSIGESAFTGCTALADVKIDDNLDYFGDKVFTNCPALTSFRYPDCVRSISANDISGCTALTVLTLTDNIVSIDANAFKNSGLETIRGYTGSAAQKYADRDDNTYTFEAIGFILEDEDKEAKVQIDNGVAPETSVLTVTKTGYGNDGADDDTIIKEYVLKLTNGGKDVELKDEIAVKINKYDDWYDNNELFIYRIDDDGEVVGMETVIIGNYVVFNTDRLGTYIVSSVPVSFNVKDSEFGVKVVIEEGVVPTTTEVNVEQVESTDTAITYDITLTLDGKVIQPEEGGVVTVKIPVPDVMKDKTIYVYRAETDGKYTDMKASVSGDYLVFTTDHFSKYIVTIEKLISFENGDVNGNGEVNDLDVVDLARYLAGWNVTIESYAADVNGDGDVNDLDVVMLARRLAGWNV